MTKTLSAEYGSVCRDGQSGMDPTARITMFRSDSRSVLTASLRLVRHVTNAIVSEVPMSNLIYLDVKRSNRELESGGRALERVCRLGTQCREVERRLRRLTPEQAASLGAVLDPRLVLKLELLMQTLRLCERS